MFKHIYIWCRERLSEKTFVLLTAFVIGVATGTLAWLLKLCIGHLSRWLTSGLSSAGPNYILLLIPVAGILLTGFFTRDILRMKIEHGVDRLLNSIHHHRPRLSPKLCFGPFVASTLTLGFGGSAGSEGPIAYTGAAVGSNIARLFRMPPHLMMAMVGAGAGAGIAGIFKSPIGGAFFTLEVLKMPLSTTTVMAVLIACIASSAMAYTLSGFTYDLPWSRIVDFDPHLLVPVILLGLFCGFYAYYYAAVMKRLGAAYSKIKRPVLRNLVSGMALAVCIFLFPSLYGEGYGVIGDIINGEPQAIVRDSVLTMLTDSDSIIIIAAAAILLLKCWAACSANSGGGVAGDFAPTLFAGAIAGLLFATSANSWFGMSLPAGGMAVIAMAAVMAGAIRAPMMAMFLTVEMTDSYSLFLPVMIAATMSWGIVKALTPGSFYNVTACRHDPQNS